MTTPIITESTLEGALNYLASSDVSSAEAKASVERTEILRKRARARCYLLTDGTVGERQARVEIAADVVAADDAYIAAVREFETLKAKRERANIVVRVYQTLEASRRLA